MVKIPTWRAKGFVTGTKLQRVLPMTLGTDRAPRDVLHVPFT